MSEINREGYSFSVDENKTKQYYKKHSLCECDYCKYLYSNIADRYPKLNEYLSQFGIDISKPDETCPVELDGQYAYSFIGYTVCGKVIKMSGYEIDIQDNSFVSIVVNTDWTFPNKQTNDYFSLSVFCVVLPCENAKVSNHTKSINKKIKNLFTRKL